MVVIKETKNLSPPFKPNLNVKQFNGRALVFFVQQETSDDLNYVMMYMDYATRFCHLRAVRDLGGLTIATTLVEIITSFGSPYIIHFDLEDDLQLNVMENLSRIFPAKILTGKRTDAIIADINKEKETLLKKLEQFPTLDWNVAIKLIQFELNQGEIQAGVTPYESLFGIKVNRNGRNQVAIPLDLLQEMYYGDYENEEINDEDDVYDEEI